MAHSFIIHNSQNGNIIYEHYCDTSTDLAAIPSQQATLGSYCTVLHGTTGVEIYISDSNNQWHLTKTARPNLQTKNITANSIVIADSGYDGLSTVNVNVPNTYTTTDENKVLQNGELVAQTTRNVVVNGTYDTTLNNSVVVNVETGSGSAVLINKNITVNGTYNAIDENVEGYNTIYVNIPNYAFLIVTYTEETTCTITNGIYTYTAPDTTGSAIFTLPAPVSNSETWTITINNGIKTKSKIIATPNYATITTIKLMFDNINLLKADINATEYALLSNAIGDGASENGRYFTRTLADPPCIFIDYYWSNGYNGYGVITLENTAPNHNSNDYGQLSYRYTLTTPNGTTFYVYCMAGYWQNYFPTYIIDGTNIYRGNMASYVYLTDSGLAGNSNYINELYDFIDRLADIQEENNI